MSVSPRTVPQDGITGNSLVTGERFDLNALADSGGFQPPPVFAENPFQTTSQDIQTTYHHHPTTENTEKVIASITDDRHLTTVEYTCKEFRTSKPFCLGIPDNMDPSVGIHVTAKPSQTSILQTITHDHINEPRCTIPSFNSIKIRSKSLPTSTILQQGADFNHVITPKAAQDKDQEQHPTSSLSTASILQHSIPSNHCNPKSVTLGNSDCLQLTSEKTGSNDDKPYTTWKQDSDHMVDTGTYSNSRDVISIFQAEAQLTNGPYAESSLPLSTACTGKRSYHSDSDEVQFLIEVPRRHPKKIKRRHNGQSRLSTDKIHRSRSSAKEDPKSILTTNISKPPTAIPQSTPTQEDGKKVKRCESERFFEVDKGISLKVSPPFQLLETPLKQVIPFIGRSEMLATPAQNPMTCLQDQAATKPPVPAQEVVSHFSHTISDTSGIVSEYSPRLVPPKRGRPKKDTSSTQSRGLTAIKPLRSAKQDKDVADLPTPKRQRRGGKGTVAAKRRKVDKQQKPLVEGSPGPTIGEAEHVLDEEVNSDVSSSKPIASDGHNPPYRAIPWQPSDIPGGFIPSFTFPGLPFGYDWQQQTAKFYAQMYQNMQNPPQSSHVSNQHQVKQNSTIVHDVQQHGGQTQELRSRAQSPHDNMYTFKNISPLSNPSMQMSNAPQRKSSLYAVPIWSSPSVNMAAQRSSPMSPNLQQINHSHLVPNPQFPEETQLSPTQSSQPVMHPPCKPLPHKQSSPKTPNVITASSRLPTEMLVDIAKTCQVTFPFAKIAERYNRPVQDIFDGFSAIIQIPLLKSAVDNRRVTELASAKMEEFKKIKDGVFQLHERELRQLEAKKAQLQHGHNQPIRMHENLPSSYFYHPGHSQANRRT